MKEKRSKEHRNNFKGKKARLIGEIQKKHHKYLFFPRLSDTLPIELKNAKGLKLKNGTLVGLKVDSESGEMKFGKILGESGKINVERKAIIFKYNISDKFPKEVTREAEKLAKEVSSNDLFVRVDLRKKLFFTIDGDDARDFDDAVCINKTKYGYKLFVSIADVSHYVAQNSLINHEAGKRANSVYLPDKVYPMLPEALSNHICSLVPNEDRLTKTVEINFSANGIIRNYRIYNSVIHSKVRLTYIQVSDLLSGKTNPGVEEKVIIKPLKIMDELGKKLKQKRLDDGELDFDFPDPELVRDKNGTVISVRKSKRNVAHGLIEEFMIAANKVVAEFMLNNKIASIYRIHEDPDPASVRELKQSLSEMGYKMNVGKRIKPKDVQNVIFDTREKRDGKAVNMLILKSLKKAEYSTREVGHFGLALDEYTHFTSPIRRYSDLIVHRIIQSLLNNNGYQINKSQLDKISCHCSKKERISDEIQRESFDLERTYLMRDKIGEVYEGIVISIMPFGMFVELEEIYVEGFVHISEMRSGGKRSRWFLVGQKIKVKIKEADIAKKRIRLSLI